MPSYPTTPPPPAAAAGGGFTRMFGTSDLPGAPPVPPALPQFHAPAAPTGGSATQSFMARPQYTPPPPAPASGPGEYTRMFSATSAPVSQPMPQAAPAAAPAPARKNSMLPLILILAGLFLVAVIVILIFVLKK